MSNTAGSAKILDVVIIGCGAIAGGYDEKNDGPDILTHAKAYREHPGFRLSACVEPDQDRRQTFMKTWAIENGAAALDDVRSNGRNFDVASICSPTADHEATLETLLDTPIQGIFCEKPLTEHLNSSKRIVEAYDAKGKILAVNYLRRWDAALQSLKTEIDDNQWGNLQTAVCHYGKGILHNGSHMIDILQFLFGPLTPKEVFHRQTDYQESDPTLDALLHTETGATVKLNGTDSRLYDVFEAHLTFENGQIALEQGLSVIRKRPIGDNPRFAGHRVLESGTNEDGSQGQALYRAVDNLYKAITENAPLASNGRTALEAQKVCEDLLALSVTS